MSGETKSMTSEVEVRCVGCKVTWWVGPSPEHPLCPSCFNIGVPTGKSEGPMTPEEREKVVVVNDLPDLVEHLRSELDRVTAECSRVAKWGADRVDLGEVQEIEQERYAAQAQVEMLRGFPCEALLKRNAELEAQLKRSEEHTFAMEEEEFESKCAALREALERIAEMECGEGLLCGEGEHDPGCGVFVAAAALATDAGKAMLEEVSMLRGVMQRERESGFSGRQRKALETELAATRERAEKAEAAHSALSDAFDDMEQQMFATKERAEKAERERDRALEEAAKELLPMCVYGPPEKCNSSRCVAHRGIAKIRALKVGGGTCHGSEHYYGADGVCSACGNRQ